MFLRINRTLRRLRREENGVAIVAVVGVMAVGLILSSLILSSIIGGISFTSAAKADVQSQAAAESGIAVAQAGLQKVGDCSAKGGVYASAPGAAVEYRATTWIKNAVGTWVRGCPTATSTEVRIISGGDAAEQGVAGNSVGDNAYVEAEYEINIAPIVEGPSTSAVYTGSGGTVSSLTITSASSLPGDIHILNGDFNCTSLSTINGSIIVANGNLNITNTCTITGSVKASGSVKITSSVIVGGDVIAAGGGVTLSNNTIRVGGNVKGAGAGYIQGTIDGNVEVTGGLEQVAGSVIKGNVLAGGKLDLYGRINGNATSPSTLKTKFDPNNARVGGLLKIGGGLDTWGYAWNVPSPSSTEDQKAAYYLVNVKKVVGSLLYNQTGITGPVPEPLPTVAPWVDFEYDWADWSSSFQLVNWPSSAGCGVGTWNFTSHSVFKNISTYTTPTLIDSRACALDIRKGTLAIKTDIVFIAKSMTLGEMKITSGDGQPHKFWILVPDGNPALAGAQCPGSNNIVTDGGTEIVSPIYALVYTPCTISLNNYTKWRGQFYSGAFTVSSGDSLVYMPLGIPGTDLSGASAMAPPTPTPAGLGDLTSIRNRSNDGETG